MEAKQLSENSSVLMQVSSVSVTYSIIVEADFPSACMCVVAQSLVKVKVELSMDVAWFATVAAANIRTGQRQEYLHVAFGSLCD